MRKSLRRSNVLVPCNVERMLEKATQFDADILIFDLEDTVPRTDEAKAAARAALRDVLGSDRFIAREHWVRMNGPHSKWFEDDAAVLAELQPDAVVVPDTEGWDDVAAVERRFTGTGVTELSVNVESPATLIDLPVIAREASLVGALAVGPVDFTARIGAGRRFMGIDDGDGDEHLLLLRQMVLACARARGWTAFDAAVFLGDPTDLDRLRAGALASRRRGFDGCGTFYPPAIPVINEVFSYTPDEERWAATVVELYESKPPDRAALRGPDGKTITVHHYEIAKDVLARAGRSA